MRWTVKGMTYCSGSVHFSTASLSISGVWFLGTSGIYGFLLPAACPAVILSHYSWSYCIIIFYSNNSLLSATIISNEDYFDLWRNFWSHLKRDCHTMANSFGVMALQTRPLDTCEQRKSRPACASQAGLDFHCSLFKSIKPKYGAGQ